MARLEPDVISALKRQVPKLTRKSLDKAARKKFKEIKQEMINEFLGHPITQEIMGGPSASNISGTLGGTRTLFGFFGFIFCFLVFGFFGSEPPTHPPRPREKSQAQGEIPGPPTPRDNYRHSTVQ